MTDPKGWCPGALRPMESGDGLIVRLRLSGNEAALDLAAEIAHWADAYGNGAIDLSARANLQLRGVSPASLTDLTKRLSEHGLLDANAEAEAVRNVLVSPFAGIGDLAPLDVRPIAKALERELARNPRMWRLPGKFGFSFDAGPYPLGDFRPDVAFEAIDEATFAVRLGGAADTPLGPIAIENVVAFAIEIAETFLALREAATPQPRRMRDVIGDVGIEPFVRSTGAPLLPPCEAPRARPLADLLGYHAAGADGFVGVALPFGRLRSSDLSALARHAAQAGARNLRLSPWRVILVQGVAAEAAGGLIDAVSDLDLILDARDPRLKIAACPGAPHCMSATLTTRADALALAPLLANVSGPDPVLHLSGCRKGCAHSQPTRFSVVGNNQFYDLVLDGKPGDAPAARGLSWAALLETLSSLTGRAEGADAR